MIGSLVAHVLVYVACCVFLSLAWVLLGHGSLDQLGRFVAHPAKALDRDFWPIWAWLGWGVVLVAHAATVLGRVLNPRYWLRRITRARELKAAGRSPAEVFFGAAAAASDPAAPTAPQKQWVVVMFTDIAGSTKLNETLGDDAWAKVLARHRDVVRTSTVDHGGTEVTTQGDGFLVRFGAPRPAVRAAMTIQRRLAEQREAGEFVPEVRIGIHAGDAVHHSGDVVGQVVNLAARLLDAARPGEILVTEPVADAVVGEAAVDDRGLVTLKGVAQARHLLALRWSEHGNEVIVLDEEPDDRRLP